MKSKFARTPTPTRKMTWVHPNHGGYLRTVYQDPDGTFSCTARNYATKLEWSMAGITNEYEARNLSLTLEYNRQASLNVRK